MADFAKSLIIGLVVGIVCVVVIGGLILWFALGWHRLFRVTPRDAPWDTESARGINTSGSSGSGSGSGKWGGMFGRGYHDRSDSGPSSFFSKSGRSSNSLDEKASSQKWPSSPTSSVGSGKWGFGGNKDSNNNNVPQTQNQVSSEGEEVRPDGMPRAILR